MSSFPAHTFKETTVPGETSRLATLSNHGSALYLIHKDVTKTLEEPNTINEILTGSEADAQYSVVLDVPGWARGFIPYSVLNYTVSAATDAFATANLQVVGTSSNPLRFIFAGRIPNAPSEYTYNPSTAAMTSAVSPNTYGYWCAVGAWRLGANTGGGAANIFNYYSDNSAGCPSNYGIATASDNGLTRTSIASLLRGSSTAPVFETLNGHSQYGGSLSGSNPHTLGTNDAPYIALCGVDKLTCFAALGTAAPTVTPSITMSIGTASNISVGLAVRFVS